MRAEPKRGVEPVADRGAAEDSCVVLKGGADERR